jgi:hypothetical protein
MKDLLKEKMKSLGMADADVANMSDVMVFIAEKSATAAAEKDEALKTALMTELEAIKNLAKDAIDKAEANKAKSEEVVLSVADAVEKMFKDNSINSIEDVAKCARDGKVLALKADNPIINSVMTGNYSRTQSVSPIRFAPVRPTAFLNRGIKTGTVSTGKNLILWTPATYTGNVAYVGELGSATTAVDGSTISAVEKSRKLSKLVARAIISKDSMEDIPQVASRVEMKTIEAVELWLDTEIWNGTGSAILDTRVYGIIPDQSTAFNAAATPKVKDANIADLARAGALQAKIARHSCNTVWMSDSMAYKLQHTKDQDNNYIINRLVDGSLIMGGFNVITDEVLFGGATEKMLVGDPQKIQLWVKRGLEAEFIRVPDTDSYHMYVYGRQQVLVEDEDIKGLIYIEDVDVALGLITQI